MATCDGRELTQAEREAGYQQQRTGVVQALRPFSGPATVDNLVDYINRELGPAVRNSRNKVNDVFRQVADNAPSANPLAYYFSTNTANADPTTGRVRLNASPQNTATTIRISEENGRLQNVTPWLDVMAGGATTPIGVVTLLDAVNPGRSLRFDLHTMVDQGAYWDLGVTLVESSHPDPFVDGGGVVLSFIAGCASTGATVPVGSLSPVANDTFLGNVSGASAAPSAVALSTLAGAGLAFGAHTLDVTGSTSIVIASDQVQRAALTGDVTAALNSNATTIAAHAVTLGKLAQVTAPTVLGLNIGASSPGDVIQLTGAQVGELTRFATLISDVTSTGTVATYPLTSDITTVEFKSGVGATIDIQSFTILDEGSQVAVHINDNAATVVTFEYDSGSATANARLRTPGNVALILRAGESAVFRYFNSRWRCVAVSRRANTAGTGITLSTAGVIAVDQSFSPTWTNSHTFSAPIISNNEVLMNNLFIQNGVISASFGSTQNNWNPTGLSSCSVIRATATATTLRITGIAAQSDGTRLLLINAGSNVWTLDNESVSSTAANRISHNVSSYAFGPNDAVELWYDGTSARWRCIHTSTSS